MPTASYRVPTNKGYVLYDENGNAVNYVNPTPTMPIDVVNAVRDAIPDLPPPRQCQQDKTFLAAIHLRKIRVYIIMANLYQIWDKEVQGLDSVGAKPEKLKQEGRLLLPILKTRRDKQA